MTTATQEPTFMAPMTERDPLTQSTAWPTALRGLLAILFGIVALASPGATALALVIVFAIWAFIDAGFAFYVAVRRGREGLRWGWFVFEGMVSVAAGVLALAYAGVTILVLTILVAARAIVLGIITLAGTFTSTESPHRWLYGLTGALSVLFGVLLLFHPLVGALALIWMIGIYAIIFGVTMLALGFQVYRHRRHEHLQQPGSRGEPWGPQMPTPARG